MSFPWYEIIKDNTIEQGDFVDKCPVVLPPADITEGGEADFEIELIDSIVLSQSCDLVNNKLQYLMDCPYYSLQTFISSLTENDLPDKRKPIDKLIENLRKGNLPAYHLLNKNEERNIDDYLVIDFKNVHSIHIESLKSEIQKKNKRIRLLPPYREHLSQAFARYFMRVGLPQDIRITRKYNKKQA